MKIFKIGLFLTLLMFLDIYFDIIPPIFAGGEPYQVHCVRNVEYIIVTGGKGGNPITPLLQTDGSISTCLDEESQIEYEEDLAFHEELSY